MNNAHKYVFILLLEHGTAMFLGPIYTTTISNIHEWWGSESTTGENTVFKRVGCFVINVIKQKPRKKEALKNNVQKWPSS